MRQELELTNVCIQHKIVDVQLMHKKKEVVQLDNEEKKTSRTSATDKDVSELISSLRKLDRGQLLTALHVVSEIRLSSENGCDNKD